MSFLRADGKAALSRAIVAFEARTGAELVIVVEPRAGHYLHVPLAFACLAALATLAFLLYGEPSFALHWFLIDPVAVALATAYLTSTWSALERLVTPAARRDAWVLRAARAAFVARHVCDTRARTGVLLYIAVGERRAVVLADLGVRQAVPAELWSPACAAIDAAVRRGEPASALPPLLVALADLCAEQLPRHTDDENELSDEVDS